MERWPIAPDGYIPNSVIRGWGKKRKRLPQTDESDNLFSGGHREQARKKESECEEEDEDEEEEEEEEEEEKAKVGMSERSVLLKESYIVRTKIRQQKTSDGGRMEAEPRRQTLGDGSTKAERFVPILSHSKESKQQGEQREEPPLQRLNDQRRNTFITNVETPVVSADDFILNPNQTLDLIP
ncbi:chromogranin-A-like [Pseudoliparis swirei]|uniref:chromogranin-A-like n=1 Tax=Pseudoliparis swirei TaxID=2059687 RepID=UPI0024BDC650|nr:chromogranin-A-like [Pseudoliparis swirei]